MLLIWRNDRPAQQAGARSVYAPRVQRLPTVEPVSWLGCALIHGRTTEVEMAEQIIIERLHDDTVIPARATPGSAGLDLRAYLKGRTVKTSDGVSQGELAADETTGEWSVQLEAGQMALIPLGFRTRL